MNSTYVNCWRATPQIPDNLRLIHLKKNPSNLFPWKRWADWAAHHRSSRLQICPLNNLAIFKPQIILGVGWGPNLQPCKLASQTGCGDWRRVSPLAKFLSKVKELSCALGTLPSGDQFVRPERSAVAGFGAYLRVAASNFGISARLAFVRSTRQSRCLFGKTIAASTFNGVASSFPEVSLSKLLRGESVSPGLLALKQTTGRRITESQLSLGIGNAAAHNPLMSAEVLCIWLRDMTPARTIVRAHLVLSNKR